MTQESPKKRSGYDFEALQKKWSPRWAQRGLYRTGDDRDKPKFFCLDFFPYPSGSGLSVGHLRNYVPTDVVTRYKRARGFQVLHPMGWDAFGLPAENYALKMGVHPRETTAANVANYKRQFALVEACYDWEKEINSSAPDYYKWTQWFFLLLHERGLAYQAQGQQWWCPECQTILANEQVEDGKCWRHTDTLVTKKSLKQWYFEITEYAEALINDLETIDWPDHIKKMQLHWIGRSEGCEVTFKGQKPDGGEVDLPIFTTRPDTIFGVTYMVLAPEHPLVASLTTADQRSAVEAYIEESKRKSEIDRTSTEKEKTGVALGSFAINPFNGEKVPLWIGDYVLASYGTGAVMAVPAHDVRDFQFAKKFGLPVREVIRPIDGLSKDAATGRFGIPSSLPENTLKEAFTDHGVMVRSAGFDGLSSADAVGELGRFVTTRSIGRPRVNYKFRDWLISRQRYWGCPIPIVHCPKCQAVPVPKEQLPVVLPETKEFRPSGTGRSPLANIPEWVNTTCPRCHGPAERETDTMDGFACSSWYFSRFPDPTVDDKPFEPETTQYWLPVDLYVGGAEHAVMHLLYARFWTKVMYDAGLVSFREPFMRLKNQGMMLGSDGVKMSKSRGNVVTPDEVVAQYGADTVRAYVMFLGSFEQESPWSDEAIMGVFRFMHRVYELFTRLPPAMTGETAIDLEPRRRAALLHALHKTVKKVGEDIETFSFNTAVAALMELLNTLSEASNVGPVEKDPVWSGIVSTYLQILSPIAPFLTEELWEKLGLAETRGSIHEQPWPSYDPDLLVLDEVDYPVQINGKVRDRIVVSRDLPETELKARVLALPKVQQWIEGKTVKNVIVVAGRLVSVVVA